MYVYIHRSTLDNVHASWSSNEAYFQSNVQTWLSGILLNVKKNLNFLVLNDRISLTEFLTIFRQKEKECTSNDETIRENKFTPKKKRENKSLGIIFWSPHQFFPYGYSVELFIWFIHSSMGVGLSTLNGQEELGRLVLSFHSTPQFCILYIILYINKHIYMYLKACSAGQSLFRPSLWLWLVKADLMCKYKLIGSNIPNLSQSISHFLLPLYI